MSNPVLLQQGFAGGMRQDGPRDALSKDAVWNAVDYIPDYGVPLMKRGGWTRPIEVLTDGNYIAAVGYTPTTGAGQVILISDGGDLFSSESGSISSEGSTNVPAHPPTFYRGFSILCDSTGAAAPDTWDGANIAALGGSPPEGRVSTVYKDHLVLASSAANPERIWFASAGDPSSWELGVAGQWLDMTNPVAAIASLKNMIVVFSEGSTERITGDIIPGVIGSDVRSEPLFQTIGCGAPASIAAYGDYVVFANTAGVYMTDGITFADLTTEGGIVNLWQGIVNDSAFNITATVFQGYYIVAVMDGADFVCAFMCDVKKRVWTRISNLPAAMLAATPVGVSNIVSNNCYFADRTSLYAGEVSAFFTPSLAYGSDGDGTAVEPVLELGYFRDKPGRKRLKRVYVSYYMPGDPTLYAAEGLDATTSNLYTVNTATCVCTSVGALGVALSALAYDRETDTMYGVTTPTSAPNPESLVTVNLETGAAAVVAALSGHTPAYPDFAIAFRPDGQLLGFDGDTIWQINSTSGVCTSFGSGAGGGTDGGNTSYEGVALVVKDGYLYGWCSSDEIIRYDLYTGEQLYQYTHINTDWPVVATSISPSGTVWDVEYNAVGEPLLGHWTTIDDERDPDPNVGSHTANPAVPDDPNPTGHSDGGDTLFVGIMDVAKIDALAWAYAPLTAELVVSYATDVATGYYTPIAERLPSGNRLQRIRVDIHNADEGAAFKIVQAGASGLTNIHKIEIDQLPSEKSRTR